MIDKRCKKCLWWDDEHIRLSYMNKIDYLPHPGICRKHKPGGVMVDSVYVGIQPVMDADDFCAEHREET